MSHRRPIRTSSDCTETTQSTNQATDSGTASNGFRRPNWFADTVAIGDTTQPPGRRQRSAPLATTTADYDRTVSASIDSSGTSSKFIDREPVESTTSTALSRPFYVNEAMSSTSKRTRVRPSSALVQLERVTSGEESLVGRNSSSQWLSEPSANVYHSGPEQMNGAVHRQTASADWSRRRQLSADQREASSATELHWSADRWQQSRNRYDHDQTGTHNRNTTRLPSKLDARHGWCVGGEMSSMNGAIQSTPNSIGAIDSSSKSKDFTNGLVDQVDGIHSPSTTSLYHLDDPVGPLIESRREPTTYPYNGGVSISSPRSAPMSPASEMNPMSSTAPDVRTVLQASGGVAGGRCEIRRLGGLHHSLPLLGHLNRDDVVEQRRMRRTCSTTAVAGETWRNAVLRSSLISTAVMAGVSLFLAALGLQLLLRLTTIVSRDGDFSATSGLLRTQPTSTSPTSTIMSSADVGDQRSVREIIEEVAVTLAAVVVVVDLCCLLSASLECYFVVQLTRHGHDPNRAIAFIERCRVSRLASAVGFLISIPIFLLALLLHAVLEYEFTPAVICITAYVVGVLFITATAAHSIHQWRRSVHSSEITAPSSTSQRMIRSDSKLAESDTNTSTLSEIVRPVSMIRLSTLV